MTLIRYTEGVISVLVVLTCLWYLSGALRERFWPEWPTAPSRLARIIIAVGILVGTSEVLGTVRLFRLLPLIGAIVALSAVVMAIRRLRRSPGRRWRDGPVTTGRGPVEPREQRIGALCAVAIVAGEWGAGTINAFRTGMVNVDTLWYHMPIAAGFAQSGSVVALHNINNDNVVEFYPATAELLHAVGIVLMGSDVVSPILNVGWLALTLYAGWCLGSRFGVGSLALMGTAVVMGGTELVADEPGGAYNDVVGVALVLSAVALLAWVPRRDPGPSGVAGFLIAALAAGLALGVKYTFIFPVLALTVATLVAIPRGRRPIGALAWSVALVTSGGLWYARNFIEVGNPLPNLHIDVGGLRLPSLPSEAAVSVWHVLGYRSVWSTYVFPALGQAYGPAWWAIWLAAGGGLLTGLAVASAR